MTTNEEASSKTPILEKVKNGVSGFKNGILGSVNIATKPLQLIGEKIMHPFDPLIYTQVNNSGGYKTSESKLKNAYETYKLEVSEHLGDAYYKKGKDPWNSTIATDTFLARDLELIDNKSGIVRFALVFKILLFTLIVIMYFLENYYTNHINKIAKDRGDENTYKLKERYVVLDQSDKPSTDIVYTESVNVDAIDTYSKGIKIAINFCLGILAVYEIYRGFGNSVIYAIKNKKVLRRARAQRNVNSVIGDDPVSTPVYTSVSSPKNNKIHIDIIR